MKTLVVGVASPKKIKARTLAIAKGKLKPKKTEPKVWFSSIESMAQVLSTKNQILLKTIADGNPQSLSELAKLTGRERGNLSRNLKVLEKYGLVELIPGEGRGKIAVLPYEQLQVNFTLLG